MEDSDFICISILFILFAIALNLIITSIINSFLSFISPILSFISSFCSFIYAFFSFTSKTLEPQFFKKSWDSLNIVLVLFALICVFLQRNKNDNPPLPPPSPPRPRYRPPSRRRYRPPSPPPSPRPQPPTPPPLPRSQPPSRPRPPPSPRPQPPTPLPPPPRSGPPSRPRPPPTPPPPSPPPSPRPQPPTPPPPPRSRPPPPSPPQSPRPQPPTPPPPPPPPLPRSGPPSRPQPRPPSPPPSPRPQPPTPPPPRPRSQPPSRPQYPPPSPPPSPRPQPPTPPPPTPPQLAPLPPHEAGTYEPSAPPLPDEPWAYEFVVNDDHVRRSNPSIPGQRFYDQPSSSNRAANNSFRRSRSSRSYPDLRLESTWMMNDDDKGRSNDDTELYRSRSRREREEKQAYFDSKLKDISYDLPAKSTIVSSQPHPHPQPQFNTMIRRNSKRTYEDVQPKAAVPIEFKLKRSVSKTRPKKNKARVTMNFLMSLTRRKKKKQRQTSVENLGEFFNPATIHEPSLPFKKSKVNDVETRSVSSSINTTPLQPPHPPFNAPQPQPEYEVVCDPLVRLKSIDRWNWSPNSNDGEASSSNTDDKSKAEPLLFGTSPDVNMKANEFIAKCLAACWMIEKSKSERRRSNPDLDPGPSSL